MFTAQFPWASSATVITWIAGKSDPKTKSMVPWKRGLAVSRRCYTVLWRIHLFITSILSVIQKEWKLRVPKARNQTALRGVLADPCCWKWVVGMVAAGNRSKRPLVLPQFELRIKRLPLFLLCWETHSAGLGLRTMDPV